MPEGYKTPAQPLSPEELAALKALGISGDDADNTFVIRPVDQMPLSSLAATWRGLIDKRGLQQLQYGDVDFDRARNRVAGESSEFKQAKLAEHNMAMMSLETADQQLDYWLENRAMIQAIVEAEEQENRIAEALAPQE